MSDTEVSSVHSKMRESEKRESHSLDKSNTLFYMFKATSLGEPSSLVQTKASNSVYQFLKVCLSVQDGEILIVCMCVNACSEEKRACIFKM